MKALPATAEVMEQMFALWRAMAVLGDVEGASTFDDRLVGVFKAINATGLSGSIWGVIIPGAATPAGAET